MYKLTTKQKRFVEFYNGNATEAATKAGYSKKTAYSQGQRLLKNAEIANLIKNREERSLNKGIMTREDRQKFWSDVANDPLCDMKDRLRASELLGKSVADFTEKIEVKSDEGLAGLIQSGRQRINGAE